MCTVQTVHNATRPLDHPTTEYLTCVTIHSPLHQVSYSWHNSHHCTPCRTYRYPVDQVPSHTGLSPRQVRRTVTCPTVSYPASLLRRAPTLSRVPRLRILPPCSGGLRRCHVSHGLGSCLPAREGSGAVTCPTALDPTSLLKRASVLPCVPWLWILPPYLGGFQCCHVSRGSGSCLHAQEGFGAVTYPMVPAPALYSGGFRCCHTSHSSLWVAYLKNKEMLR
jgi:hypothetical protein